MNYSNSRHRQRAVPYEVARALAEQKESLQAEVERLRAQNQRLAASGGATSKLERENADLKRTVADLRRLVEESRQENRSIASEVARLETANTELRDERTALNDELRTLQDELDQATSANAFLEKRMRQFETESRQSAVDTEIIDRLQRKVLELESDLSRVHRRAEDEARLARREERKTILSQIGEVLDSVDLALRMHQDDGPWRTGLLGIRDQVIHFMANQGATLTGAEGESLDPNLHQAIAMIAAPEVASGHIAQVHRHGIVLDDGTVARTAQVVVAE